MICEACGSGTVGGDLCPRCQDDLDALTFDEALLRERTMENSATEHEVKQLENMVVEYGWGWVLRTLKEHADACARRAAFAADHANAGAYMLLADKLERAEERGKLADM